MSFSLTTEQMRNRTKTVTRRRGWEFLKPGDIVNACVKCMGLKPGEKIDRIGQIRIVDVRREKLDRMKQYAGYGACESAREGFPKMSGKQFVAMFCRHMGGTPDQMVTRIEFEHVEATA